MDEGIRRQQQAGCRQVSKSKRGIGDGVNSVVAIDSRLRTVWKRRFFRGRGIVANGGILDMGARCAETTLSRPKKSRLKQPRVAVFHRRRRYRRERVPGVLYKEARPATPSGQ